VPERVLELTSWSRSRHQLVFDFGIDGLQFRTTCWYGDVDLVDLEARVGAETFERLALHVAAFEINKVASLRPDRLDLGPLGRHVTPALEALWREVFTGVWAQWRFENDLPDYHGPSLATSASASSAPIEVEAGDAEILAFCGGGKDSLVALDLLEEAGLAFSTLAYSSSIYGRADPQHALIDRLTDHFSPRSRHRQWIYDDFMDSPVLDLEPPPGIHTLTAAETPASVFAALPVALAHGYTSLCLAHEKSADVGNLSWAATGEEVNHQWGKSTEAEALLDDYVRTELLANVTYFSILKPVHDLVIFNALERRPDAVAATHSCNLVKPWCNRCAKCAYVFLNYSAYLPTELVAKVFPVNLFDVPENVEHLRGLLGLAEHTPFECVGQVEESRLAFAVCARRGLRGRALDELVGPAILDDPAAVVDSFSTVDSSYRRMPDNVGSRVLPLLQDRADDARRRVRPWFETAEASRDLGG